MPYLTPNSIPDDTVCYFIRIPRESLYIAAFVGAVSELFKSWNWELFGEMTPQEVADDFLTRYQTMAETRGNCMLGSIHAFATTSLPSNVLLCDGSQYARQDYPGLYDLLDSAFIVDPDYFTVPDLSDKFVFGTGANNPGDTGGANSLALSSANLPSHNHTDSYPTVGIVLNGELVPASVYVPPALPTVTGNTGSGTAFDNRPAFLTLTYGIIAL
jgi:microcystin-dependent protein